MGGGRGENWPHVCPQSCSSGSQGGGYIQSMVGLVVSVRSRATKWLPPCRSLITARV